MSLKLLVPWVIGIVSVLQAALNRRIATSWGLIPAALLNASIFLLLAVVCYLWARTGRGPFADWTLPLSLREMKWFWLLPGFFGLLIVLGLPWSIARVGALTTFIVLVASQMMASAMWDRWVEGLPMSGTRLFGALLAIVGAALVAWR